MVVVVVVEVVGKVVVVVDFLQRTWHLPGQVATSWAEHAAWLQAGHTSNMLEQVDRGW